MGTCVCYGNIKTSIQVLPLRVRKHLVIYVPWSSGPTLLETISRDLDVRSDVLEHPVANDDLDKQEDFKLPTLCAENDLYQAA